MKVRQLLRKRRYRRNYISPDAWVITTLRKLQRDNAGALVVSPDGREITGIISERDIARGISRYGARVLKFLIADLMSENVISCRMSDSVVSVAQKMVEFGVRHIPVVNSKGHYVAMVNIRDIVKQHLRGIELASDSANEFTIDQAA